MAKGSAETGARNKMPNTRDRKQGWNDTRSGVVPDRRRPVARTAAFAADVNSPGGVADKS